MHYKRQWRHGNPHTTLVVHNLPEGICYVDGCDNQIGRSDGLCEMHAQRMVRYGRLHNVMNSKGEGGQDSNGYFVITVNGRRVLEHIYKAEQALGKPLPEGAVVHHVNGVKHDNDTPFNLVICPDQAYHLLLHRRAKELGYEGN